MLGASYLRKSFYLKLLQGVTPNLAVLVATVYTAAYLRLDKDDYPNQLFGYKQLEA